MEVVSPPTVVEGLKRLYNSKIRPLEQAYNYEYFHSPLLEKSDFDAAPIVLLLGQYSVGKTSFIRYLLGKDFPNQRIGPEPTTDRFVAVMNGPTERSIPGNALCVQVCGVTVCVCLCVAVVRGTNCRGNAHEWRHHRMTCRSVASRSSVPRS